MAGVSDYSTDPNANTSINGINIAELCPAANLNNAIRQIMADIRQFYNTYVAITFPVSIAQGGTNAADAPTALANLGGLSATYKHLPQSAKAAAFAFDITQDAGHVFYTGAAGAATIPANATVAFPIGTVIVVVNHGSGALTLTRAATVALKWANTGADADRTLAAGGVASLIKVDTNTWVVSGGGLT